MSNRALEEWSRILVVFGNERLLSEQTVLVGRLAWFSTKRDLCSLVEPAWSWKRTESGLVVTTNSKLEHEECCFQRIPLQDIGKLLKIVWKTVVVGRDWVSLPRNAIYDHLGIVTTNSKLGNCTVYGKHWWWVGVCHETRVFSLAEPRLLARVHCKPRVRWCVRGGARASHAPHICACPDVCIC